MNEIDEFMDMDATDMSTEDLDKIIAYHRKYRAQLESGPKKRAKKEEGPKQTLGDDFLKNLVAGLKVKEAPAAPTSTFKRRI